MLDFGILCGFIHKCVNNVKQISGVIVFIYAMSVL